MISIRIAAACVLVGVAAAEEPPAPGARKYTVVAPMAGGMTAAAINGKGDVVGFHWEPENGDPNVLYEAPFLARGGEIVRLPLLETYTATFPAGVSDDDVVVGRSSKPAPPNVAVYLRNQAFVWTEKDGIRGLGAPEPDVASFASGISRDGRRISGFGVGDRSQRALIWDRDGDAWKPVVIPEGDRLGSNVVAISPDGKRLAATRGVDPTLWTETAPGEWKSESLDGGKDHFIPRAVNDAGTVVGFRNDHDGTYRAVVWTPGQGVTVLSPPPGFVHAQATAINNAGVVVGQVDGPHGGLPGPRGFVYEDGKLRVLDEAGPDFTWATAINDAGQVAGVIEMEEEHPDEHEERPAAADAPVTPR
ncbi:HAF repeat-containing protein [Paludisphaera sp.]|uniref:HAF repeat-containing protein n=1 Tax=Paludisphaera sp. TaxID=2017432 RepID=UPI00301CED99